MDELVVMPDIIFFDINMPTIDGKSCIKCIKNDSRFAGIPVIVYTTSANEKDKEQCLQLVLNNISSSLFADGRMRNR
jgi:CheY-like chemotaxis protein